MKIVDVKGTIISQEDKWIYDWLEYPYTTSNDINKQLLEANGEDVQVNINSNGGSVYVGSEIYTSLKSYLGNLTINIVGMAASAASVVAMAAKCLMSPTGQMMIHNASMGAQGDYRDMNKASEILQSVNKSIANAYKFKTGMSDEDLKNIMDNETWLTAQEAKDLGLIDEIMFENTQQSNNSTPNFYNSLVTPSTKAIEELKKCGSVEAFKENIINNKVQNTVNSVIDNKNTMKEAKIMNFKNSGCQCSECSQDAEDCKCSSCGQCPSCCDNPSACGCNCDNESCSKSTASNCKNKKEEKIVDLNQLKNKYPDIYEAAYKEGKAAGTKNEQERIKSIENLAIPGNEDIINKAKFETGITAEAVAVEIIKAQKAKGTDFINQAKKDAIDANLLEVNNIAAPENNKSDDIKDKENADYMAKVMNGGVK